MYKKVEGNSLYWMVTILTYSTHSSTPITEEVIPPKAKRIQQHDYDENLYADRNKVERFYNKAKQYRRLATRYEKTARNYLAF